MQRPNDNETQPPGGRAAERLKEFLRDREANGDVSAEINAGDDKHPVVSNSREDCEKEKSEIEEE